MTGVDPVTEIFVSPWGWLFFLVSFAGIVGLYGGGALLIREFVTYYHKGWASVLLLGAAYGIGEEGFAVHTFFETSGSPVNAFATYGHAFGVNWLWAFGLSIFHATYSIALPILLVGLLYPASRGVRWLDGGAVALTAVVYLFVVALFSVVVGYGPSVATFALFLGIAFVLIALAGWVPRDLLRPLAGAARIPPWGIAVAASLPFDCWTVLLILSSHPVMPAWAAGGFTAFVGFIALVIVVRRSGSDRPEWTQFYIATGMIGALAVWDVIVEFSEPFILLVTAFFLYLLIRLRRTLPARDADPPVGAIGPPPLRA